MIEFELRPGDSRVFDAWRSQKYAGVARSILKPTILGATAAGLALWYASPDLLGLGAFVNFIILVGCPSYALAGVAVGFRFLQEHRYRAAPGFVDGKHSLHFSAAGVHHIGPLGIERFQWRELRSLDVGVHYLFMRFASPGSVIIPVCAIERFGPTYDEAFLLELAPLIEEGVAEGA